MKTDIQYQMNAEKPDDVLADLERKHGCAAPSGSAATCEWLSTLNTEETCNKPATHERMMGKPVRYCTEHAMMLAKYTELRTIKPPNDKLKCGGENQPASGAATPRPIL